MFFLKEEKSEKKQQIKKKNIKQIQKNRKITKYLFRKQQEKKNISKTKTNRKFKKKITTKLEIIMWKNL